MNIFKRIYRLYREAYSGLPREVWLLCLVELINRCGTMVFFFMTLYMTREFGVSAAKAAEVISSYGFGALLGAYLGGKMTDTIGAYRVQKISMVSAGLLLIVLGHIQSFGWIMVFMFLVGAISEALHPANTTAVSLVCPPELRTRGFALNRLAANLGVTIGPALGGYLALADYTLLFWVDGLTYLAAAVVFMKFFKTAHPPVEPHQKSDIPRQSWWKDLYFLKILFLVFLMGAVFVQLFNTFPLYMKSVYLLHENHIGLLMAISTSLIVLFEMLLMHGVRNKPVAKLIGFGAFVLCLGFALMPLGKGFLYAAFTVTVWTFGEMLAIPPLVTLIANQSDDSNRGKYMGLFSFSFALSLSVGPAVGGKIYSTLGPDILWYACGLVGLLLWPGFALFNKNKQQK